MEKELNIAAILKDKPNARIYDLLHNIYVKLDSVSTTDKETVVWCRYSTPKSNILFDYSELGTERGWLDGLQILKPSKEMQDWSKFAWKKGDVLTNIENNFPIVFDHFKDDEYTLFYGKYAYDEDNEKWFTTTSFIETEKFNKAKDGVAKSHLRDIEEHYCGKLNLSTLQIEQPKQEFKDGDIVVAEKDAFYDKVIFIAAIKDDIYVSKAIINVSEEDYEVQYNEYRFGHNRILRQATDSEKQQLFDALEKKNKVWDEDKKMLVDLPKKCEFKPMDWCLMRDHREKWKLCQFGFFDKGDEYEASYNAVGGNWYNECIPYNDSTKHLLGTTDEWEGGK